MSNMFEAEREDLENVAKVFGKTTKELDEEVKSLKEWLQTQKHLPEVMDDDRIRNFLLFNKCNLSKTKRKIDDYYTMRSKVRHIFDNPKSETMKVVNEAFYVTALPKLTDDLYRVFVLKARKPDLVADLRPYHLLANVINMQEIRIKEDLNAGDLAIVDYSDVSLRFLLKMTPRVIYYHVQVYQKLFSSRLKALYLLTASSYMATILTFVKLFMKRKLYERIHVCTDAEILKTKIPEEILPKDYGGKGKSLEEMREIMAAKFEEYQTRFDELDTFEVDENLRYVKTSRFWEFPFASSTSD